MKTTDVRHDPFRVERGQLLRATPRMRFDGGETAAAWQERARGVLGELLGLSKIKRVEEDFSIEYDRVEETPSGKVREIRFLVQSEKGYYVPSVLWLPHDRPVPMPVCICLQGHSTGKHISMGRPIFPKDGESIGGGDRDFAVRAVKEGFATLCMEQRCMGECGSKEDGYPDCTNTALTAILTGRTLLGERVWDVSRVIDALYHFPEIDEKQILCMGNSGGGTATVYAAAMDTRIAAAMPSCAVCRFDESIGAMSHCACNYVPYIANFMDMGDLIALVAPRPLVVVSGREDPIFPLDGAVDCVAEARRVYESMGVSSCLAHVVGEGGHRFYADDAWGVLHSLWQPSRD